MLLSQLHERKAARILHPAPTAADTQIRTKRLFPRAKGCFFFLLQWWVASKVPFSHCSRTAAAQTSHSRRVFVAQRVAKNLLSMHNKCLHLNREGFSFFMALLVLDGGIHVLGTPTPRTSQTAADCAAPTNSYWFILDAKHCRSVRYWFIGGRIGWYFCGPGKHITFVEKHAFILTLNPQ